MLKKDMEYDIKAIKNLLMAIKEHPETYENNTPVLLANFLLEHYLIFEMI